MSVVLPPNTSSSLLMRILSKSTWVFFLYFFIFQPPVINKLYYVFIELLIFLSFSFYRRYDFYLYISKFKYELIIGLIFIFICVIRDSFTQNFVYTDRFIAWYLQCILFPFVILNIYEWNNLKTIHNDEVVGLYDYIYIAVFIAGLITLLLINFPVLDDFYKGIQLDSYYERYENFEVRYRAYGVSENLTFTYGYILGVYAGIAFLKCRKNIMHIGVFLVLLIGVSYNARIGFIPIMFIFIFALVKSNLKSYLVILLFGLFFLSFFSISWMDEISIKFNWALSFFTELFGFLTGQESHTMNYLFHDFIVLPSGFYEVLFGTGESLFDRNFERSDVGFIIQFYYAGILFLSMLLFFMIFVSLRTFKVLGYSHWFSLIFCFSLFLLNTKGFVFAATPGARLLFLLYISVVYFKYRTNLSSKQILG